MKRIVKLADINIDKSPIVRAELSTNLIEEYAEQYRRKKHNMPPPLLFAVDKDLLVADGRHRISAMRSCGIERTVFEVWHGTRSECVKAALGANVKHGHRRTNEDKRMSVRTAIMEFPSLTDNALSDIACVDHSMVGPIRAEMAAKGQTKLPEKAVTRNGRQVTYKPKAYSLPTPKPEPPPEEPKPKNENQSKVPQTFEVQATVVDSEPELERDSIGYPIPPEAIVLWKRTSEASSTIRAAREFRSFIRKIADSDDPLYAEVKFNPVLADLDRVYDSLKVAVPFAVCPSCQGRLKEKCKGCNGRGLISEFRYHLIPEEDRKLREKACKK